MATQVTVNGNPNYADNLALSSLVTLGILNPPASATYNWTIVDQPPGSGAQATLSSPTSAAPTFTVANEGTYLLQCVLNQGSASQQQVTGIAIVRQLISGERIQAANETIESNGMSATEPAGGYAVSANTMLRRLDKLLGDSGVFVGTDGAGGLAVSFFVQPTGEFTLANGVVVPSFTQALATSTGIVNGFLGVVIGGIGSGGVSTVNALMRIRWLGFYPGISYAGVGAPTVGAAIYATDDGVLDKTALSAGTHSRVVGTIVAVNTGAQTFDVFLKT